MTDQVLLADIGGTNARFALLDHGRIGPVEHVKVADYATAYEAIEVFLARHLIGRHVRAGMLGIAGPLEDNRGILTNGRWIIDADELQKTFALNCSSSPRFRNSHGRCQR
jgi:glucokinase